MTQFKELSQLIPNDVIFGPADFIPGLKTSKLPMDPKSIVKISDSLANKKSIYCHNIKFVDMMPVEDSFEQYLKLMCVSPE